MDGKATIERLGQLPGGESGEELGLAFPPGEAPRPVVLQPLPQALGQDASRRAQLEHDLARAARLSHPNLASPLGLEPGAEARAEPWADGERLSGVIAAGGRMPPAIAARIVSDACAAVAFAHEEDGAGGLVHGHLRPEALLVTGSGSTLVTGLGAGAAQGTRPLSERLPWVSPEQILGGAGAADRQTDVYLLGLVLHACLAGEAPFGGEADVEKAVLDSRPAPLADLGVPAPLAEVAARAVSKKASDRQPSAGELRLAIEGAAGELASPAAVAAYVDLICPPGEGLRAERLAMVEAALRRNADAAVPGGAAGAETPSLPPTQVDPAVDAPAPAADLHSLPVELVRTADILVEPAVEPVVEPAVEPAAAPALPPDLVTTRDIMGEGSAPFMVALPPVPAPEPRGGYLRTGILAAGIAIAGLAVGYGLSRLGGEPLLPWLSASPQVAPPSSAVAPPQLPAAPALPPPPPELPREPAPSPAASAPAVRAEPRKAAGPPSIEVTTDPPGEIYVDGRRVGRTPVIKMVSRGRHKIRLLDKASGIDVTKTVEVKAPRTPVRFDVGKGTLTVTAPAEAEILLDGRKVGTGRVEDLSVYAGSHQITVRLGSAKNEHVFRIAAGETYSYDVEKTSP